MRLVKLTCPDNEVRFDEDAIGISITVHCKMAAEMLALAPPDMAGMAVHVEGRQTGPFTVRLKEKTAELLLQSPEIDISNPQCLDEDTPSAHMREVG